MKNIPKISLFIFVLFFSLKHSNDLYSQEENTYKLNPDSDDAYQAIVQFYQYDEDIPLEASVVETVDGDDYVREKIVFIGINNSRVIGYLATPKTGKSPYPCVLQMHGMTVSKSDFWAPEYHHGELVTQNLLSSGFAVLALDMPYHGDRLYENDFESTRIMLFRKGWSYRFRDMVVQCTIEYRRAMDYLETRQDIDENRIGAIGYSIGGVIANILTGIDKRIKATVSCVAPTMKPRRYLPSEEYLTGIASHTFARSINTNPYLMLMGEKDTGQCPVDEAKQLFELIESDTKDLIFYDSGHKLPKEHAPVAAEWLIKFLDSEHR